MAEFHRFFWLWLCVLCLLPFGEARKSLLLVLPCENKDYFGGDAVASWALERAARLALLKGDNSSTLEIQSGSCDPVAAANEFIQIGRADAVLGPSYPSNEVHVAATLASVFNKTMFTWYPSLIPLEKRKRYTSLIQAFPPSAKLVDGIVSMLEAYNVTQIAILSSSSEMHLSIAEQVLHRLTVDVAHSVAVAHFAQYGSTDDPDKTWLQEAASKATIILLCIPRDDLPAVLALAASLQMKSSDYWYITYDLVLQTLPSTNARYDVAEKTNLISVRTEQSSGILAKEFHANLTRYAAGRTYDSAAGYVYDALLTYFRLAKLNYTSAVAARAAHIGKLAGVTGEVKYDANGDRESRFDVMHYSTDHWVTIGHVDGHYKALNGTTPLFVTQEPRACVGKDCGGTTDTWVLEASLAAVGGLFLVVLVIIVGLHTRAKYWRHGDRRQWLIAYDDIKFGTQPATPSKAHSSIRAIHPRKRLVRMLSHMSLNLGSLDSLDHAFHGSGTVALYKGHLVVVKQRKHPLKQERKFWDDLNFLKDLRHDNLNAFVGATADGIHQFVVFAYCSKGSLRDILLDEDKSLDWTFKMSFLIDISRGMRFLHKSAVHSHGNLKSLNCVVDGRWVVKLTDYGLLSEVSPRVENDVERGLAQTVGEATYEKQLWTAPELLRIREESPKGTQKGDVYSFAIVTQEILQRSLPFHINRAEEGKSAKDIVEAVRAGQQPLMRPIIDRDGSPTTAQEKVVRFLPNCWNEDPRQRPDFLVIKKTLIMINGNKKVRIVDNMINMLESYANNLEDLVSERTKELQAEKVKTENLLLRMLPKPAADRLKVGMPVDPESFDAVSIFFSDIVGFTTIASDSQPIQIVNMLNKLYTRFDEVISQHDVYKVETIGDAYMCVSGLPVRNGQRHCAEIANMALDLLSSVLDFTIDHMPEKRIQLRIGLHTGPCVAGVVGTAMPRYCLFGDTVNTASRMESTGRALKIHLSEPMNSALLDLDEGFTTKPRGRIEVKGKGMLATYWLLGKQGFRKPLPAHSDGEETGSLTSSFVSGLKSATPSATPSALDKQLQDEANQQYRCLNAASSQPRLRSAEAHAADARSAHNRYKQKWRKECQLVAPMDSYQMALLSHPNLRLQRSGSASSVASMFDMADSAADDEDDDSAVCTRSVSGGSTESAVTTRFRRASSASCCGGGGAASAQLDGPLVSAVQMSDGSRSGEKTATRAKLWRFGRGRKDINRNTYTKRSGSVPCLPELVPRRERHEGRGFFKPKNKIVPAENIFSMSPVPYVLVNTGPHRVFLVRDSDEISGAEADA